MVARGGAIAPNAPFGSHATDLKTNIITLLISFKNELAGTCVFFPISGIKSKPEAITMKIKAKNIYLFCISKILKLILYGFYRLSNVRDNCERNNAK